MSGGDLFAGAGQTLHVSEVHAGRGRRPHAMSGLPDIAHRKETTKPSDDRRWWKVCRVCGAPGAFGFGASVLRRRVGRWACFAHRDEVDRMAVERRAG